MRSWLCLTLAACAHAAPAASPSSSSSPSSALATPRAPIALTYLGVAGWQLDAAGKTILTDPYFTRPADPNQPLVPDAAAIAAHAPAHADLIVIGHSHYDHLLDAAEIAKRTGAELIGSLSTIRVALASGVPETQLTGIAGGEDLARDGFSVRVIRSLHSMIGAADPLGEITDVPHLPMPQSGYKAGGTFAYLIRIAGHEVLILDTANFIESELAGVHPDIAIIAPGLREQIRDYSCRLVHVLGDPPIVIATHFDDWKHAPADQPTSDDLRKFVAEIQGCSPHTRVIVPKHFERMAL